MGLPLVGTAPNHGFYAHDVLGDMLSSGAPLLNYRIGSDGTIAKHTGFILEQLAFLDPGTVAAAIDQLNAYFLYRWEVWENKSFWWQPWDPSVCTWKARIEGGAFWAPAGRQASTLFNGVVVSYTDHTGARKSAGPPGSGCDVESALLVDNDPSNPVTRHGRRRWAKIDVGFPLVGTAPLQIGYVWLQEHSIPQRRGTLVVRPLGEGHVPMLEHPTEGPLPVWACRSGDFVDLVDFPDPEPFKVIDKRYDHDSKTLTLSLDNSSLKLDAILERVGIRLAGVI
jgi:hypothetical protein